MRKNSMKYVILCMYLGKEEQLNEFLYMAVQEPGGISKCRRLLRVTKERKLRRAMIVSPLKARDT